MKKNSQKQINLAWLCIGLGIMLLGALFTFFWQGDGEQLVNFSLLGISWLLGALLLCKKSFNFHYSRSFVLSSGTLILLLLPYIACFWGYSTLYAYIVSEFVTLPIALIFLLSSCYSHKKEGRFIVLSLLILTICLFFPYSFWRPLFDDHVRFGAFFYTKFLYFLLSVFYVMKLKKFIQGKQELSLKEQQNDITFLFVVLQLFYAICIAFSPVFILVVGTMIFGWDDGGVGIVMGVTVPISVVFFIVRIILAERKLK